MDDLPMAREKSGSVFHESLIFKYGCVIFNISRILMGNNDELPLYRNHQNRHNSYTNIYIFKYIYAYIYIHMYINIKTCIYIYIHM